MVVMQLVFWVKAEEILKHSDEISWLGYNPGSPPQGISAFPLKTQTVWDKRLHCAYVSLSCVAGQVTRPVPGSLQVSAGFCKGPIRTCKCGCEVWRGSCSYSVYTKLRPPHVCACTLMNVPPCIMHTHTHIRVYACRDMDTLMHMHAPPHAHTQT